MFITDNIQLFRINLSLTEILFLLLLLSSSSIVVVTVAAVNFFVLLLLLLLPPPPSLSLLLPLKLLLSSFLSSVHSKFFPMLQSACAYLPYPVEVFDPENFTLLLVILSTYTERFFLMYCDKITIILYFLFLIRFFFFLLVTISYFVGF